MLNHLAPRDANRDAILDSRTRRQDHLNRSQVARIKKDKARAVYARIAWGVDGSGNDLSQCELCDSAGVATGVVAYIDGPGSIERTRPQYFGDCWFEVERVGTATRSAVSKALYRAKRFVKVTGGYRPVEIAYTTAFATIANVINDAGAVINTTIGGGSVANVVPVLWFTASAYPSVGLRFDAAMPVTWALNNPAVDGTMATTWMWALSPDIVQTQRIRGGGYLLFWAVAKTISVDCGESFSIDWAIADSEVASGNTATFPGTYFSHAHGVTHFSWTVTPGLSADTVKQSVSQDWVAGNHGTTAVLTSPGPGSVNAVTKIGNTSVGSTVAVNAGGLTITITTSTFTLTFTFTQDATTKRLTSVTLGLTSSFATTVGLTASGLLRGGRPPHWPIA